MGAPSAQHERRVDDLRVLATLTGHTVALAFPLSLRPDVCAGDLSRARIFVGDAKASEHPSCPETRHRFAGYADICVRWHVAGIRLTFALAHPPGHDPWVDWLAHIAATAGFEPIDAGHDVLAVDLAVSWLRI